MGRTKRTQVALYLDDDKVAALKRVADRTGLTQQDVLRNALDDLFAKHREGAVTTTYVRLRVALKSARGQLSLFRRDLVRRGAGLKPLQDCDRAISRIDMARASVDN